MSTLVPLRQAVTFLTRLPAGASADADGVPADTFDLTAASAWFPAVGGLVAAVGIATRWALGPWIGTAAATVAAVLATVVVTGAFHEDGLADSADGLWGGATAERRLEIMRDSRLGTYGTTALVGDLGLRVALLAPLSVEDFARAMLAAHVVGRLAPLVLVTWLPPARADGQGVRTRRPSRAGWSAASITAAFVAWIVVGRWSPLLLAAGAIGTWLVGRRARAAVGGLTGDLLGAGVRVSALLVLGTVVVLARAGAS